MNRSGTLILGVLLPCATAFGHITITTKITWSREISRIVVQRCLSCHRDGGNAPMPLATYEQSRPWAVAIQEAVLNRQMPPWGAVKGFGEFANDSGLTQDEITLIAEWVEGGAPEGDPNLLPEIPRKFPVAPVPAGQPVRFERSGKISSTLTALRTTGPVKVMAELPDGSMEPLLWVPQALKKPQTFLLRQPLSLGPGSRLMTSGAVTAYLKAPTHPRQTTPYSPTPRAQTAPKPGAVPGAGKSR